MANEPPKPTSSEFSLIKEMQEEINGMKNELSNNNFYSVLYETGKYLTGREVPYNCCRAFTIVCWLSQFDITYKEYHFSNEKSLLGDKNEQYYYMKCLSFALKLSELKQNHNDKTSLELKSYLKNIIDRLTQKLKTYSDV